MDGQLIIGTTLDSTDVDKELAKLERDLSKFEKQAEKLTNQKMKLELDSTKAMNDLQKIDDKIELINKEISNMERVNLSGNLNENIDYQRLLSQRDQLNQKAEEYYQKLDIIKTKQAQVNEKTKTNATALEITRDKLEDISNHNISNVFKGVNGDVKSISDGIGNVVKKVVKWGMAVFGVRAAYNFIKQSVSTLSQYDKQMAANIEYIRYAIANTLKPIIETVINLVVKLLGYINYIAKAWFGVNLFANASAKAFEKQKQAIGGSAKKAKELQKTLAGFDEMNILQKDGSVSSGGGGGGVPLADFDLADIDNIKTPKWLEWIVSNKTLILDFFKQLAAIIATIKVAQLVLGFANLYGGLAELSRLKLFATIGGFALSVVGISKTVEAIVNWIKNPTWGNFVKILEGLSIVLVGIGVSLVAINAANPLGWIVGIAGTIGYVVTAFGDWSNSAETTTKKLIDTKQATEDLKRAQEELAQQTSAYTSAVKNAEQAQKGLEEAEKKHSISGADLFRSVQIGTLAYENLNEAQREVFDAYVMNLEAQGRLSEATKDFTNAQKDLNQASSQLSGAVFQETQVFDDYFQELLTGFENGDVSSKQFYKSLEAMLRNMDSETKKVFVDSLPQTIKDGLAEAELPIFGFPNLWMSKTSLIVNDTNDKFKNVTNDIKSSLDPNKFSSTFSKFKTAWNNNLSRLTSVIGVTTSISTSKHANGGIVLPRLASGGIINQPGRGVPLAGAIGGESGREGIIPLTDSAAMSLLGYEIGRNVNITATIPVQIGNRKVAQEIRTIHAEDDFAMNG